MAVINATGGSNRDHLRLPHKFECQQASIGDVCGCATRRGFMAGVGAVAATAIGAGPSWAAGPAASTPKPFRIDVHHHLASPGFIEEIKKRKTGQTPLMNWTPSKSIDDMDKGGVATSILSISEPGVWFGNLDETQKLARECNEYGAKLIRDFPGRFGLFAILPMHDVDASLKEIEYALDTLKTAGIVMMSDYDGKFLGDPAFSKIMDELNRRKAVVFVHPFRNACCVNLVPEVPTPTLELGFDTTRTIASLLFSGTAVRCPDIKFIFSHAGGTVPFLMQRFQSLFDGNKGLQARLPLGLAHYLQKFFYDTASASTIYPLSSLTKLVSPSQIVFGTDFPFLTAKATASELRATGLFDANQLNEIERENAMRLMPKYQTL